MKQKSQNNSEILLPLLQDPSRLEAILKTLPHKPGVYLMKGETNNILYIGKAIDLSKRVRHYFHTTPNHSAGTRIMMPKIFDIEIITVSSELEALLLEINLIKENKPRYNVVMRDDKNYAFLKITTGEDYPKIITTRKKDKDKALYFGPYMSTKKIHDALDVVKKLFPYRSCGGSITWVGAGLPIVDNIDLAQRALYTKNVQCKDLGRKIPCLDFHIKRCQGPCLGIISPEDYFANITKIIQFLRGNFSFVKKELQIQMQTAVSLKHFEWAAKLRDHILLIDDLEAKQSIVSNQFQNIDAIGLFREDEQAVVTLLQVRNGRVIQILQREMDIACDSTQEECIQSFFVEYYGLSSEFPEIVLLPMMDENEKNLIKNWCIETLQISIQIENPQKGAKWKLIEMAQKNAQQYLIQKKSSFEKEGIAPVLHDLKTLLELTHIPKRIECYDISHTSGTLTVASQVVFENARPKKSDYRRFQIESVTNTIGNPNDFQSMREVLARRLKYLQEKKNTPWIWKKATKTILQTIISVKNQNFELFEWFYSQRDGLILCIGSKKLTEAREIHCYDIEGSISEADKAQALLDFLYNREEMHFYIADTILPSDILLSIGVIPIHTEVNQEKSLNMIYTWYKKEKKRKKNDPSFSSTPDLIIVDGGKGQLTQARQILLEFDLDIPCIGLAKKEEEIILPNNTLKTLPFDSPILRLLVHLRDESHRFANTYEAKRREKKQTRSKLDRLPISLAKQKILLQTFQSFENIQRQDLQTLIQAIGESSAQKIYALFHVTKHDDSTQ